MKTEARKFRLTEAGKPKAVYPQIGVVTPVRNRKNWTLGFVERFARQDYPIFTHYIVDSASTDGTPEAITALPLRSVRLLRAGESAYWTAATNVGVRQALKDCCDFILTINDDAIVAEAGALIDAGKSVTVVTSDRALRGRVEELGATVHGPRWLEV